MLYLTKLHMNSGAMLAALPLLCCTRVHFFPPRKCAVYYVAV